MADKPESKSGPAAVFSRFGKFFRDQKSELKKVVWPSKKQIINNTGIVLAAIALFAVATGAFDWLVGLLIRALIGA